MEGRTRFRHASFFVALADTQETQTDTAARGKVALLGRSGADRSMGKKGSTGASAGRLAGRRLCRRGPGAAVYLWAAGQEYMYGRTLL